MTRYKLTIEYEGTDFAGWQRQPSEIPTIQHAIEEAIFKFSGQNVKTLGAGRTDAGVHACGQIAHVDLEGFSRPMDGFEICKAINAYLRPKPITILKCEIVDDEFHARFHATNKLYRYRLINRPMFLTWDKGLAWQHKKPLNITAMREGAKHLIGHHDFTTFRASECQAKSPEKTLDRLEITTREYDDAGGKEIIFAAQARSFLHHQVRNMVGALAYVGEGKWQPDDVKTALKARDRTKGAITAPADGLYLVRIDYDDT